MSSTRRRGEAAGLCRYYTPDDLARAIVALPEVNALMQRYLDDDIDSWPRWLEPSAGGGAFLRALAEAGLGSCGTALDIDPDAPAFRDDEWEGWERACCDFRDHADIGPYYDLIVGNPPFSDAEAHIRHALSLLRPGGRLVFLLRLAFLAGQARGEGLWEERPPRKVYVLSRRPSFTGGGTDSADYAVVVWEQGWAGETRMGWLRW